MVYEQKVIASKIGRKNLDHVLIARGCKQKEIIS